jgi:diguanylate cyclase (GGDEF)-like protein
MVEELRFLAITDKLTGIYNRLKLDEVLTAEILRAKRYTRPLAVILIDIDQFKLVNDTYGHLIGDTVLKEVSSLLNENMRESDFVGRWGGEEFLVINPETTIAGALVLAQKLRKVIAEYAFAPVGRITISLGVASLVEGDQEDELLRRADEALYRAKNHGGNRVEL